MTRSMQSRRPRRSRRQLTAAALVLLASVGWAHQVSAGDPVVELAIDPDTPTKLYAGTMCAGLLKSLDGADSWNNTGLRHTHVRELAIDPTAPDTLYAGTDGGGVFRSLNGGSDWSAANAGLTNTNGVTLAINPVTPTTLYAGMADYGGPDGGGVFRSRNGGSSWSAINPGPTNGAWRRRALAISPTVPATLYAARLTGLFKSVNGGDSWQATGLGGVICGDGIIPCGHEQCDDGNLTDGDGCDSTCRPTGCGSGAVTDGEQCDDGNRDPFDGCSNDCIACGDGVVTPPEECDSSEGCDTQCRWQHVVGTGTPQSCTEAAFAAALAKRSVIFNCGADPVTITLTSEKMITADTTIDGGGRITLSGGGEVRIFGVIGGTGLDLWNLTIADGNGAIENGGTATLTNCTLSGNSASADADRWSGGGGIYNYVYVCLPGSCYGGSGGTLTLRNTLVATSPSGGDCTGQAPIDASHNLIEDATNSCGLTNGVNGNLVGVDPQLGPLTNNGGPTQTIALLPGSPAINAGDADVCATAPVNGVDQRGYVRPGTGHTQCSIGAYEADAFSSELCVGDCGGTGSVTVNARKGDRLD